MTRFRTLLAPIALAVAVLLVVVGRIVLGEWPVYPDEAGFFLVSRETFHGSGDGLYGGYWVDRPPTLVWLFGIAAAFDDVHAIRWVATVLLVGFVAAVWAAGRVLGGVRGATAAAVVGAAFVSSPLLGAEAANGEALAIPFVAAGGWCVLVAFGTAVRRPVWWAFAAGLLGMVALTIKQNFADVFVLAVLLAVCRGLRGELPAREVAVRLASGVGGAVAWLGIVLAWVVHRGSDFAEFWEVAFRFRTEASGILQASHTSGIEQRREIFGQLVWDTWLAPLVLVLLLLVLLGRAGFSSAVLAVTGLVGFEAWCVVAGGSWWTHYLMGMAPGLALAVAVGFGARAAVTWSDRAAQALLAVVVIGFVWTQVSALPDVDEQVAARGVDNAQAIGGAIADVAQPGDTLTVMYGAADLQWSSGLESRYRHLWSLPVRVLDPDLAELRALLNSDERPTFLAVTLGVDAFGLDPDGSTAALIEQHYTLVGEPCGQQVWVRHDVRRDLAEVRC